MPTLPKSSAKQRDPTIDVLRGFALVAMVLTHGARLSTPSRVVNSPIYVDAGDLFIMLSGFTLGMVATGRLKKVRPWSVYRELWRRAGSLWLVHVGLMASAVLVNDHWLSLDMPRAEEFGGFWWALFSIASLRFQSELFLNILPLFVVFFLIAPVALDAIVRGRWYLVIIASFLVWLAAQFNPELVPLEDKRAATRVFSVAGWQFAFMLGLTAGVFRSQLLGWLEHRPHSIFGTAFVLFSLLFVFVWSQSPSLSFFGATLPAESWQWAFSKRTWGPLRVLYAISELVLLFAAFLWVQNRRDSHRAPRWVASSLLDRLALVGRHSLLCFIVHIPLAITCIVLNVDMRPRWSQDSVALLLIGSMYLVAWLADRRQAASRAAVRPGHQGQATNSAFQ